jgi:hypothetical protein
MNCGLNAAILPPTPFGFDAPRPWLLPGLGPPPTHFSFFYFFFIFLIFLIFLFFLFFYFSSLPLPLPLPLPLNGELKYFRVHYVDCFRWIRDVLLLDHNL